jgi:hypothetical protein
MAGTVDALRHGMNKKIRWVVSVAAGITAFPAGYAANLLMSGSTQIGTLLALTNTLALIH